MGSADALHDVKRIAANGQVSVGKACAGKLVRVEPVEEGILLRFVRDVPEGAWWTQEPYKSDLKRALAWAAEHPAQATDLDALMAQARAHQAKRARAAKAGKRSAGAQPTSGAKRAAK